MPQSRTAQTQMDRMEGNKPALDADGMIADMAWYPKQVTKTASYTVKETESGTWFNTTGATAAVTFTLPAISTGPWVFRFIAGAAQNLVVAAGTADTMVTFNNLAADSLALSTSGEIIGGAIEAVCDGTTLYCNQVWGVSHRQTATVAT